MQTIIRFRKKDNLLECLNAYIEPVDSEWLNRLKPADESMLDKLQLYLGMKMHNLKLPVSFIEFSKFAGESDGGLLSIPLKGKFSIEKMVEVAKEIYEYEPEYIDPYNFEFLLDEVGLAYIIKQGEESGIYYEDTCWISSSFENLLFQCAVRLYEQKYFRERIFFGSSMKMFKESEDKRQEDTLSSIMQEIVSRDNLQCVWFNDEYFFFAYGDDYSILLEKNVTVAGTVMGNDKHKMHCVLQRILPQIGAVIVM